MFTHHSLLVLLVFAASVSFGGCTSSIAGTGAAPSSSGADGSESDVAVPGAADGGRLPEAGMNKKDSGTDAGASAKATYCDGVAAPAGSAEFLCADFDSLPLDKGWDDVSRSGKNTLKTTSELAASAPLALLTTVTGGPADSTLLWKRSGIKAFTEVTAKVQINPAVLGVVLAPVDDLLELLDIRTSTASVTFGYSRGSDASGSKYFGYYVNGTAFGGANLTRHHEIAQDLQANVWTELVLVWNRDGRIDVTYDGNSVLSAAGFASTDTVVSVRLGAHASGDVGGMPAHRFDNAEFSIRRTP